jgi:hypothetical protein
MKLIIFLKFRKNIAALSNYRSLKKVINVVESILMDNYL